MKTVAIYPGTFDPITNGHVDVITRAANLFNEVIVAVATSKRKTPLFAMDERKKMIKDVFSDHNNVTVLALDGLLVEFAKQQGANIILRGLRAVSDFDYEFQMAGMNRHMAPDIETVFLPASEECAYISSTMVREIISLQGDASDFVPQVVAEKLRD